jgi:hypothetical protein
LVVVVAHEQGERKKNLDGTRKMGWHKNTGERNVLNRRYNHQGKSLKLVVQKFRSLGLEPTVSMHSPAPLSGIDKFGWHEKKGQT